MKGINNEYGLIRKSYGVPAKRGGIVFYEGKVGHITSAKNSYLRVKFPEMKRPLIFHPKSVDYLPF